jgi:glutamate-1-semialdehyde aminotransferase/L-amino acid N-acyltransferase YncA
MIIPKTSLTNNTSTTSKRSLWPEKTQNLYVRHGEKTKLQLSNGLTYDDWCMALSAVTLGYHNKNAQHQPNFSFPHQLELFVANKLVNQEGLVDRDYSVRFFKSGSDAVSCAVRIARYITERKYIVVFDKCYHGTGDWFGGNLWSKGGIVNTDFLFIRKWNDIDDLNRLKSGYLAAIVLEPIPKAVNCADIDFYRTIRKIADYAQIPIISDEIILGFRSTYTDIYRAILKPEFICLGKALAQGFPLSAVIGPTEYMNSLKQEVHFSGTNNGDAVSLYRADEVLQLYKNSDIIGQLYDIGQRVIDAFDNIGIKCVGLPSRFEPQIPEIKRFTEFCFDNRVLFPEFCSIDINHSQTQIDKLVSLTDRHMAYLQSQTQAGSSATLPSWEQPFKLDNTLTGIRDFEHRDAWSAYVLRHAAPAEYLLNDAPTIEQHNDWIVDTMARKNAIVYVLNDNVVGIASIKLTKNNYWININVHSNFRRKGIATKLLYKLIQRNKDKQVLCAEIHNDNLASMALFKKLGFVPHQLIQQHDNFTVFTLNTST